MSDGELDSLARHLGHDVQTHKQNYRLSHATRELTVVSQLLIAVDNGCVNKWKGKQLTDISVDELPDVTQFCEEDDIDKDKGDDVDMAVNQQEYCEPVVEDLSVEDTTLSDGYASVECTVQSTSMAPAKIQEDKGKRSRKVPWSRTAEEFLRKSFKYYLNGTRISLHNSDLIMAKKTCMELSSRTLAQIRSKLNNMKLGKSK